MDDEIDSLLVEVRAGTDGFARDLARMRGMVDGDLVAGFDRAGKALEKGLADAVRRGSLGFDDLRRVAFSVLDAIAGQAARTLAAAVTGGGIGGGSGRGGGLDLAPLLSAAFGLPGRATGGNVAPGRGYVVGESGPELFVPTSAGRIEASAAAPPREVRVAINLTAPRGASTPPSLQRSTRQVASALRRALAGR